MNPTRSLSMNQSQPFSFRRFVQSLLLGFLAFAVMPMWSQPYVYFSQQPTQGDGHKYIGRANLDGTGPPNLQWLQTNSGPAGIALSYPINTTIYWAHEGAQTIGSATLGDNPNPSANLSFIDTRGDVSFGGEALFSGNVMTLTHAVTAGSFKIEQTVTSASLPPSRTFVIAAKIGGGNVGDTGTYLLRDNTIANALATFTATQMTLTRVPDGYSVGALANNQYVTAAGVPSGTTIAYNAPASGSAAAGTVGAVYNLSPTGVTPSATPIAISTMAGLSIGTAEAIVTTFGNSRPLGVATDGTYIYWTESPEPATAAVPRVCRVKISTPNVYTDVPWIYMPTGSAPWQITYDTVSAVYWTEQNLLATTAGRVCKAEVGVAAGVGGTEQVLQTGQDDPTGIAANSSFIFWANANDHTVHISDLNGGAVAGATHFPATISPDPTIYALACNNNVFFGGTEIGKLNILTGVQTPDLVIPYTGGGTPIYGLAIDNMGTVVTLSSFNATPSATQVVLAWTTGSEVDTAGFNIWRSSSATGIFAKVNTVIIPAKGTGIGGATYTWTDNSVNVGDTYFYKLDDIDTNGTSTLHGPVSATVGASSPILSFQGTPSDIFLGGSSLLSWTVTGTPKLSISGIGPVSASSLLVSPLASTSYVLSDTQGNQSMTTVNVKPFGLLDLPGLSKAWGSKKGDANYNPSYDLNGDGKVDDVDVALCFKGF